MIAETTPISVQLIQRPERKLLLKRGIAATGYFEYCDECGCDVFDALSSVKEALSEPVGMWLPEGLIPKGTSRYVQGVELPMDYDQPVPEGFELITLPPAAYLMFRGEPYDDEEYADAIRQVWAHIEQYDPGSHGYTWAWEEAPRFQMEPRGARGYIEACPVRKRASTSCRRSYGTASPIHAIAIGMIAAQVAPAAKRAHSSAGKSGASAQAAAVAPDASTASETTCHLPKRSASGPKTSCISP